MQAFHDVDFPLAIGFGATGGPVRANEIVTLTSGRERRNQRRAHAKRRYDAGTGLRSLADLTVLTGFFEARRGSMAAFRFRDPFDHSSAPPGGEPGPGDQILGEGDGLRRDFALRKAYGAGEDAYWRPVTKPVAGSVKLAVDGVSLAAEFTVDPLTGIVTLADAPAAGAVVTAGFLFDVPVRFDADDLSLSLAAFAAGQAHSVPLVEVLP